MTAKIIKSTIISTIEMLYLTNKRYSASKKAKLPAFTASFAASKRKKRLNRCVNRKKN